MPVSHYENFPVASWLLPARLREPVVAIYNFARYADDLADEGDAPASERLAALDACSDALRRIARGETPDDAPFTALAHAVRAHRLPLDLCEDLLSAFKQDVVKKRYANWDELLDYCRRSANPIGRLLLHLYDRASPELCAHADAICTGLQLANFWQDIAVDWLKDRIYLPLDDMNRFGVTEHHVASRQCDPPWRALVAFEVERTRAMLASGRPLARALPLRAGLELKLVIAGGLRILSKIDAARGDVFRRRPILDKADWMRMSTALIRE